MKKYRGKIAYDRDTILRLSLALSRTYRLLPRLLAWLTGFVMLLFSLRQGLSSAGSVGLLAAGCLLITSINAPARRRAKLSWNSIGGKPVAGSYSFGPSAFSFEHSGQSADCPYHQILRLMEDGEYLYLCTDKCSAYMLEKSSVLPSCEELRDFLSQQTGLHWKLVFSLMSFRLDLFSLFQRK